MNCRSALIPWVSFIILQKLSIFCMYTYVCVDKHIQFTWDIYKSIKHRIQL